MPPQPQPGSNNDLPGSQPAPDLTSGSNPPSPEASLTSSNSTIPTAPSAPPVSPGPQAFGVPQSPLQSAPSPQNNASLSQPMPGPTAAQNIASQPIQQTPTPTIPNADTPPPGPVTGLQTPMQPNQPSNYATASGNLSANTPSGAFVGSDGPQMPFTPQKFGLNQNSKPGLKGTLTKKPVIALLVVAFLGLGFLAFWFGYYNNPKVIYSQAMKNTNKGYEKLISYASEENSKNYKSMSGTGKMSLKAEGTNVNGTMNFKSSNKNSQFNAAIDLGIAKVNVDALEVKNPKGGSDVYFKVSGLKSISSLASSAEFSKIIGKTENTWIYIDPETAGILADTKSSSTGDVSSLKNDQLLDAAAKIGEVNKKYLFTTNQDNAVLKVSKNVGKEDVDGHTAYHYEMTIDSANAQEWVKAQKQAVKSSKLYTWMKQNGIEKAFDDTMDDSAKNVKNDVKDVKIEMWVDTKTRIIYKMRAADKKSLENYTDLGLDYTGGSKYPFFVTANYKYGQDTTNVKFQITIDSENKDMNFELKATSKGSSPGTFSANFDLKPGNETYKIEKPANAKSLSQILNELGYGEFLKELQATNNMTDAQIQQQAETDLTIAD